MKSNQEGGNNVRRRTLLHGMGIATTTGVLASTLGKASANKGNSRQFVGISYDPLTQQVQQSANAVLSFDGNGLTGVLQVAGYTIPVGDPEPLAPISDDGPLTQYRFERDEEKFMRDRLHLQVSIRTDNDRVVGHITRPSREYGKSSFTLGATDKGFSEVGVQSGLENGKFSDTASAADQISIPSDGIPKENSLGKVVAKKKSQNSTSIDENIDTQDYINPPGGSGNDKVGFFDEDSVSNTITYSPPSSCLYDDQREMDWEYLTGTSAIEDVDDEFNQIEEGKYKYFHTQGHFTNSPNPLAKECDQDSGVPYPIDVEFWASHGSNSDINDFDLENPRPDNDGSNSADDGTLGLALDVINSIGGTYTAVATTIINYGLDTQNEEGITVEQNQYSDKNEIYWDLPFENGSEFPDGTDNTAGVKFKIDNNLEPGRYGTIETMSRITFGYLGYPENACPCSYQELFYEKTTGTCINYSSYECIPLQ